MKIFTQVKCGKMNFRLASTSTCASDTLSDTMFLPGKNINSQQCIHESVPYTKKTFLEICTNTFSSLALLVWKSMSI